MSNGKSGGGKGHGGGRTAMTPQAASRVQSRSAQNPVEQVRHDGLQFTGTAARRPERQQR